MNNSEPCFPHVVYDENEEEYYLYLEFRPNQNFEFLWHLTYVGNHGILYKNENEDANNLLKDFYDFSFKNNIKYNTK